MSQHDPKRCRSCNAPIFWAKDVSTGKSRPVDAAPDDRGNAVLYDRGGTVMVRQLERGEEPHVGEKRRMFHHATCPDRANWQKSKRS